MVEEMSRKTESLLDKQYERERKLRERGPASLTPATLPPQRPKPPLIFIDAAMEIIQGKANPSYEPKVPLPICCPTCEGSLYPEIYSFNAPRGDKILAFRCRKCRFFFRLSISLNPEHCNEDLALRDANGNIGPAPNHPAYPVRKVA